MPDQFSDDPFYGSYNLSGIPGLDFGNPIINGLVGLLMQGRVFPRPVPGTNQSPYDAIRWQQRTFDMIGLQRSSFANQRLFESIGGMNPNGFMAGIFSNPNGFASSVLAPFAGGNPMAAAMGIYGKLNTQTLASFGGGIGEVTPQTTGQIMRSLSFKFYNRGISSAEDAALGNLVGEKLDERIDAIMKAGKDKLKGQNWGANRGFKIEDITGGFAAAGRTGLFRTSSGAYDSFNQFFGVGEKGLAHDQASASIKLMDAMRGVFGNDKSGAQLWEATSTLLGSDSLAADGKDSGKLEDLLRRVKSTARVLGVDISTMTQMVETFKEFGRQNNLPFNNSGMGAMESVMNAVQVMTATKGSGGTPGIRAAGGEVQYTMGLGAVDQTANVHPLTKWLGAVYHKAGVEGKGDVQKRIREFLNDPNRDTSHAGYNAQLNSAARALGMSSYELQSYAQNNAQATMEGLNQLRKDSPMAITNAIGTDVLGRIRMDLAASNFGSVSLADAMMAMTGNPKLTVNDVAKRYGITNPKHLERLQSVAANRAKQGDKFDLRMLTAGYSQSRILTDNPSFYPTTDAAFRAAYDPVFNEQYRNGLAQAEFFKKADEETSAKLAKFNAPVLAQLASALFDGTLKDVNSFMKEVGIDQSADQAAFDGMKIALEEAIKVGNVRDDDYQKTGEYRDLIGKTKGNLTNEQKEMLQKLDPSGRLTDFSANSVKRAHQRKLFGEAIEKRFKPLRDERDKEVTAKFAGLGFTSLAELQADLDKNLVTEQTNAYRALEKSDPTKFKEVTGYMKSNQEFFNNLTAAAMKETQTLEDAKSDAEFRAAIKQVAPALVKIAETLSALSGKT